jgi:hypothetical protein
VKWAFDLFEKSLRAIVIQVMSSLGVYWINTKLALARRFGGPDQSVAQKFIKRLAKWKSAGAALLLHTFEHILIEGDGGSDAHDASILASRTSGALWG